MTLFEIGEDLRALEALLDESGGEITPENESAYDAFMAELGQNQAEKLDGYIGLLKTWEGQMAAAQAAADQFLAKVKTLNNRIARHKARLMGHMLSTNQKKMRTAKGWDITIVGNGGLMPLILSEKATAEPKSLPTRFQKLKVEPDNAAIRKALDEGESLDFASLAPRGQRLAIK